MAGTAISFTHNMREISSAIRIIAKQMGDTTPAMKVIGATVESSILRNFEKGGRPAGWTPLRPATLSKKKGGSILIGHGHAGGLMGSIHFEAGRNSVMVGTNKIYAAIHQFGGMAGRGHKTKIPARPFLMVQDEDWDTINDGLCNYILQGKI